MKPKFIIIGAQKCGTSSLHRHLDSHPDISMSTQKELNFFVESLNWKKGIEWYESQFTKAAITHGESSPSYTMYPKFTGVPGKIHSYVPDAKLIYIVRDPIDRIVSHYLHQWYDKRLSGTLSSILSDPASIRAQHYINTSNYYLQLSQYLEFYKLSNIYTVSLESLRHSPQETMQKIFRFLEVDDNYILPQASMVFNATQVKVRTNKLGDLLLTNSIPLRRLVNISARPLPPALKARIRSLLGSKQDRPKTDPQARETLRTLLQDDMAKFRELTGQSFEQWSI